MSLHALPPSLISPYTYLISTPGKNVRSHLIDSFNKFYLVPPKTLASIKEIVSMLHNASLLIDDIEDNSSIRRGRKSAHLVYGVPATINCGNYLYFACVQLVQQLPELDTHPNPNELRTEAMNIFINECLNLHRGQGYDILWRDTGACPTMEQYNDMINDKTGGLFRIAVGLMRVFATTNADNSYSQIVEELSLYFQIRDDYVNLANDDYMKSKTFCEDITEGKFSHPIIHYVTHAPELERAALLDILKLRTSDIEVLRKAQQMLKSQGSLKVTLETVVGLSKGLLERVGQLEGGEGIAQIVKKLDEKIGFELEDSPPPPP